MGGVTIHSIVHENRNTFVVAFVCLIFRQRVALATTRRLLRLCIVIVVVGKQISFWKRKLARSVLFSNFFVITIDQH